MNKPVSAEEINSQGADLIDEIIRLSDFTFDRLPMLDIIGERLVENLSVAFPDLTGAMCETSLTSLDYIPLGQIVEGLPSPVLLAVSTGVPFDGEILLTIDRSLLLTSIELMLGGDAKTLETEGIESFTAIEMGFGERLAAAILAELQRALLVVGAANLVLDHVDVDVDAANVAKSSSLCARMKVSVALAGQVGVLDVIIPYDALEPIRPDLGKIYFGDRGEDRSAWQEMITGQIERANLELEVVLAEEAIPIQKIMAWQPGDTVDFGIEEGKLATMFGENRPLFEVSLGKRNNGFVAVQIAETINDEKDSNHDGHDN